MTAGQRAPMEFAILVAKALPDLCHETVIQNTLDLFTLARAIHTNRVKYLNTRENRYADTAEVCAGKAKAIIAGLGEGFAYKDGGDPRGSVGFYVVFPDNAHTNSFTGEGWGIEP